MTILDEIQTKRIAIVSRRIYLTAHGLGDDKRFARLLKTAWQQMPRPDRRLILDYWRSWPQLQPREVPCIVLLDSWSVDADSFE